jgi:hypothetical protein
MVAFQVDLSGIFQHFVIIIAIIMRALTSTIYEFAVKSVKTRRHNYKKIKFGRRKENHMNTIRCASSPIRSMS